MGQLVIEVPQNINLKITVKSAEITDEILQLVKNPKKNLKKTNSDLLYDLDENETVNIQSDRDESGKTPAIIPPRRNSLKKDLAEAVGIWADRDESAAEIARRIRDKNNGKI